MRLAAVIDASANPYAMQLEALADNINPNEIITNY